MPPGPKVTYDNSHATNSVNQTLTKSFHLTKSILMDVKDKLAKRLNSSDNKALETANS